MKIKRVGENFIEFDNGKKIEVLVDFSKSYADCKQLDEIAFDYEFNEDDFRIEFVDNFGFRFGNDNRMFGVPCYDEQDGYYSTKFTIKYNNEIYAEEKDLFT